MDCMRVNILMVDDRQENLIALESILEHSGYNLFKAHSGAEALKYLLHHEFAVILLDVNMPGMDGFETAQLIRGRDKFKHTPIIFITAAIRNDVELFKGYESGAVDFIYKPIVPEILQSKISVFVELYKQKQEIVRLRQFEQQAFAVELAQTMAALQRSEEQYRLLFETNPQPMWIFDQETLTFLTVNNAAINHYGYTRAEFLAMTIKDIRPPEEIHALLERVSSINSDLLTGHLVKHRKKDGKLIDVEITSHAITFEGKRARFVLANDVTEKKKLESQFLRAQRMESIGTLAGGIAHDLNNILTPVIVGSQLLTKIVADEKGKRIISTMVDSAQRGADMVRQVLSFARGVEGKRIELNIKHLVTDIEKFVRETFPKSICIETAVSKDLWTLNGDATQIYQVLMNMCVNARDAMPDGGKITIEAENITIDEHYARMNLEAKPGQYVLIKITDTGSGIPPEVLTKIFEPFFTTKEIGQGTGLGLSTSVAIVKSHGGFINVYSEIERGSTFMVYLPISATILQQQTEDVEMHILCGSGELILVVDDEAAIREIAKVTLEAYGYEVITANDGTEAVAMFASNQPRVKAILMDMMMPNLDGHHTAQVLLKMDPNIKIIATSGFVANKKKVEDLSIKAFLPKPYTAELLLETVSGIIQSN